MTPALDRDAQAVLEAVAASGAPHLSTLSVDEARARVRAVLVSKRPPLPLHDVQDVELPTLNGPLRARIYRPTAGTLPAALFLHGGGWTVNDLDTHDELCRRLAKQSGWVFFSIEYRKAPDHKHPAAIDDAHLAYRWLRDHAGALGCAASPIALVGESSGATIAASLSTLLRDLGAPLPDHQVLVYPATDAFDRWPSYRERGTGYILDRALMRWYFDQYWPQDGTSATPYLVPLAATDLSGLPPTLMVTAEFDPLRDEGIAYVKRLAEAGVAVEHVHAADQMHGFLLLERAVPSAGALVERIAAWLARARQA
jgi:acetyl esterase